MEITITVKELWKSDLNIIISVWRSDETFFLLFDMSTLRPTNKHALTLIGPKTHS